jgi:hypothetical protein
MVHFSRRPVYSPHNLTFFFRLGAGLQNSVVPLFVVRDQVFLAGIDDKNRQPAFGLSLAAFLLTSVATIVPNREHVLQA